jgi:MFS family permease
VWRETKAKEPIIPLHLFKNGIFSVTTVLSLLIGLVMFGAIIFLPQYQQLVRGDSATKSGLMLLPLVVGIMSASLSSGRIISKIGRYRFYPNSGTIIVTTGFFLFSHITATTNRAILGAWMFVLGFGIGQVMPVLTLAVQNAVERKDLGAATSSVVFFRSIGSSLGAAIFGAIILNRLTFHIGQVLPGAAGAQAAQSLKSSAAGLSKLSPQARADVLGAFAQSFHDVFLIAIPFAVTALLVALFLKEAPLRTGQEQIEAEALENTGHL